MAEFEQKDWALILGGSSGFGLATAKRLSRAGMSVCVVHRDRRGAMKRIEEDFEEIRANGNPFVALNTDALSADGIEKTITLLKEAMGQGAGVKVVLHSIAFGNLKSIVPGEDKPYLQDEDMAHTIYSMGTSLLSWTQSLHTHNAFAEGAQVIGLTSEGNVKVWEGYSAVSAAKVALESVARSIAVEFASLGVRANIVQAGVTNTPALKAIPGHENMIASAEKRNPFGRLTTPEDVANAVYLLCRPEANWINGAHLHVDGGEHLS